MAEAVPKRVRPGPEGFIKEVIMMLMNSIFGGNLFDDFFDDFSSGIRRLPTHTAPQAGLMKTDIKENEKGYELHIDLPGYNKEDVKAELKDGYLTITATSKNENDEEKKGYIRRERFFGSCSRSFYVGEDLTQEDIKGRFENGVLKLEVPKKESQPKVETPKYIAIE